MAKNPESPLEPFKRALVNATRSLAESSDLEIVYSGEGPQLSGHRAVLLASAGKHSNDQREAGAVDVGGRAKIQQDAIGVAFGRLTVRTIERGETVGYAATWAAARSSRIAVVAVGESNVTF